jgi:Anti-sigma factor NepR
VDAARNYHEMAFATGLGDRTRGLGGELRSMYADVVDMELPNELIDLLKRLAEMDKTAP